MRQSYKQGVTLIELLVVIAIIGILSVVSVVALSSAKSSRQVRIVADEIKDKILDARAYAVAPSITTNSVSDVKVTLTTKAENTTTGKASVKVVEMNGATTGSNVFPEKFLPDNIDFEANQSFSFSASQQGYIGQILDSSNVPVVDFSFIVKNTSGTEKYLLIINRFGYVTIIKQ